MSSSFTSQRLLLFVLSIVFLLPHPAHCANRVTDWNAFALEDTAVQKVDLLKRERAIAIMQIAVYEAANAARPTYCRSAIAVPDSSGASVDAAVTQAAYATLSALVPLGTTGFEQERTRQLALIADSSLKTAGISIGTAAAAAVLKWRADDGADFSPAYTPGTGDGAYQPTSGNPMAGPVAAKMHPFNFDSYAAFRPPPPPPLDSLQMRRDLEEIAIWGGTDSTLRTADEAEIANFHARPGLYGWSEIARQLAAQRSLGVVESARLLALVEVTVVDSHYALWEAKYFYNLWRPITALRAGGGPLHLTGPKDWTPFITTPMIPEYPCAHCGLGSAVQVVLEGLLGDGPIDVTVQNGTMKRHYHSLRQYADEESISRIYGGVHYRWSNYVGEAMGRQVGAFELTKVAQPLPGKS